LGRLVEALERHRVALQVDPLGAFELGDQPVDDRLVEVVAAEVVVARGRLDLEHALTDLEHRAVEGAAAEVEDEDRLVGLLVETVGQRGGGRLVDDPLDVEAGDLAGVLGRLTLIVVEVGGNRDHRGVDALTEIGLGVGLQLLQDHRADLRRRELLTGDLHARVAVLAGDHLVGDDRLLLADLALLASHEALDRKDRVLRVGHRLALGDRADEALTGCRECHHRRRRTTPFRVLDDGWLPALQDGHARVRRAEVDTDRLTHVLVNLLYRRNKSKSEYRRFGTVGQTARSAPFFGSAHAPRTGSAPNGVPVPRTGCTQPHSPSPGIAYPVAPVAPRAGRPAPRRSPPVPRGCARRGR